MSDCHECTCFQAPPCAACVDCRHWNNDDDCGDCATCPQQNP